MCVHSLKKKIEVESKNFKKIMIFDVLEPEMKDLLFVCLQYNTLVWHVHNVSQYT